MPMDVQGLDELMEAINDLGEFAKYAGPFIRNAIDAGAEVVRQEAETNAQQYRTGGSGEHLADNVIVHRARITKNGRWLARVGVRKKFAYAIPLEHGHLVDTVDGVKHVPARPFLAPAWESKKNVAMEDIRYELARRLPDIMKRVARAKARKAKK